MLFGNITSITDNLNAGYDRTYGYDDLNRLTTANTGASLWGTGGYTYDAMGNILNMTLGSTTRSFSYYPGNGAGGNPNSTIPLVLYATQNGTTTAIGYDLVRDGH
ncbi:MAG TPA: hypothetical protein VME66_03535 [Candidatus Acidoferrales bacterium]|nr:hypothetical protein [Candidatus Acidoferrales bacterium]